MDVQTICRSTERFVSAPASREAPWGSWRIVGEGPGYRVKLLELAPGRRLSLHYHHHRSERWVVLSGRASIILGDRVDELTALQSAVIPAGVPHRIGNGWSRPLVLMEFQHGREIRDADQVCLDDDH